MINNKIYKNIELYVCFLLLYNMIARGFCEQNGIISITLGFFGICVAVFNLISRLK